MTELVMMDTFRRRADRLAKFVSLKAPTTVLAMAVCSVFDAAFAAFREEMAVAFSERMMETAAAACGVCPACDKSRPHELHLCDACILAESDEMDKAIAEEKNR